MQWVREPLGEICRKGRGRIQTGPFGSQLHESDYSPEGIPVVMPADIADGKIAVTRIARVSERHVDRLKRHKLSKGDIVYGRRGDIGRQALVRDENIGWLCGTGCLKISLGDGPLTYEFLHRYLSTTAVVGWIEGQAVGATMPNLNTGILERVPVFYPEDTETQDKIAAILSAYDELIENNQRRIALLEKMAEEIYREWFVRRRFPGYDMVKVIKGVPEGWQRKKAATLTSYLKRGVAPQYDDLAEGIAINQKCIRYGKLDLNFARHQSRDVPADRQVKFGDVLVNSTGEGTLGRVAQVLIPISNCIVDSHVTIVRPKPGVPIHFFGMTLKAWEVHFSTMGRGATNQTELAPSVIGGVEVTMPSMPLQDAFESYAEPLFAQITILIAQNERLTRMRDLLLPRLISGKLSVENLDIHFPPGMVKDALTPTLLQRAMG